jgi:hypothetical protein
VYNLLENNIDVHEYNSTHYLQDHSSGSDGSQVGSGNPTPTLILHGITVIIVLIHGISSIIALLREITVQMLWNCNGHWVGSWLINMFTNWFHVHVSFTFSLIELIP